jgi:peptidoglycan hydrolase-like protein with peptidoglycan-binding domain
VTGSVTEAQLETGSVATRYQWVNTVADYDTVGFNKYLKFDGVDDILLASLAFSQHPHMIVTGIRPYGFGDIVGTGNVVAGDALLTTLPPGRVRAHVWTSTVATVDSSNTIGYGLNRVSSQVFTSDTLSARLNGVSTTIASTGVPSATESGTLIIGSRNDARDWFNGNIYSLIIRGVQSTDAQIINAETYVNSKTGAY